MFITKEFTFSSAHNLTNYHGKCEELHGHNFKLSVTLLGNPEEDGMIIDFALLKKIVEENVITILDHKYLNKIIENPTSENIASWIFNRLSPIFDCENCKLYEVRLWESETSSVAIRREKE